MNGKAKWTGACIMVAALIGCATAPEVLLIPASTIDNSAISNRQSGIIVLLRPRITYQHVRTGKLANRNELDKKGTAHHINKRIIEILEKKSYQVHLDNNGVLNNYRSASELSDFFEATFVEGKDIEILQDISYVENAWAVMVPQLQVMVGQGTYMDPVFTGQIYAGTSRTMLTVSLLDWRSGLTIWQRASFFRALPNDKLLLIATSKALNEFPPK